MNSFDRMDNLAVAVMAFRFRAGTALALAALCFFFYPLPRRTPLPGTAAVTVGAFAENGAYPATHWPRRPAGPLVGYPRVWGSWGGDDDLSGTLRLGPFVAPAHFRVSIAGGPTRPGNALFLQRLVDGARWPLPVGFDPGLHWEEFVVITPHEWINQMVELRAVDEARGPNGWVGVSEPYRRAGWLSSWERWRELLLACLLHAACFGLPGWVVWRLLAPCVFRSAAGVPAEFALLGAASLGMLLGYGVFWIYWWSPLAGRVASWIVFGVALGVLAGTRRRTPTLAFYRDVLPPLALMALIGLFNLSLLCLPRAGWDLSELAQVRFAPYRLPGDNLIPGLFAERLYAGANPRTPLLLLDWHSSDRPPLQTGALLLGRPLLALTGLDADTAGQTGGMLLQLLWVPAAWCFLRRARLPVRGAAAAIAALAATGFFVLESTFVWPKMAAGALGCGIFCLLLQNRGSQRSAGGAPGAGEAIWAAAMAALAFLAHGGVIFSLIAFALLLCLPPFWLGWRHTALGIAVFLALYLPWSGYQKLYDPPGDRLLKWHLAGVERVDSRSLGQTLREAYAAQGWQAARATKLGNFRTVFHFGDAEWRTGHWPSRQGWRNDEFSYVIPSFGVFNLGWLLAAPWLLWRRVRPGDAPTVALRGVILALAANLLTAAGWSILMFESRATVIYTCSYTMLILTLASFATLLWAAGPWLFRLTALVSVAIFMVTYVPVPPALGTEWDALSATLASATGGVLALVAFGWPLAPPLPGTAPGK